MNHLRTCFCILTYIVLLSCLASAQSPRTFVSGLGNDSNRCSRTAPCRPLQAAFNATAVGGGVTALDSEEYGSVTVTNAITIEAPLGVHASVTNSTMVPAIEIDAGSS